MHIQSVVAREILDSRGNPTVEADVMLDDGVMGRASVPSGASTGAHEACELRDNDGKRYGGKGVLKAVANVSGELAQAVIGKDASAQREIDEAMIALDGTENKSRLGANAILAVSLAVAHAAARAKRAPLFEHLRSLSSSPKELCLPVPQCNIVNGGAHTSWESTDIQEFMIMPVGAPSFREGVRMLSEIFHTLKGILAEKKYGTTVGDEGGFAPHVRGGNEEVFELLAHAVERAGYRIGTDVMFATDVAASEFVGAPSEKNTVLRDASALTPNAEHSAAGSSPQTVFFSEGAYHLPVSGTTRSSDELIGWYQELVAKYPMYSIEDGLGEEDWEGWRKLTDTLGGKIQLVGDDLLVTNVKFLERAISEKAGNAILIKVNQIGTLTETIDAIDRAHAAGWRAIVSHRSGETEDTMIAHLVVGLGTGQIKTGSVSRGERTAKYNELLRIEEMLGAKASYAGSRALK